jgi:hypothetical protein
MNRQMRDVRPSPQGRRMLLVGTNSHAPTSRTGKRSLIGPIVRTFRDRNIR